MKFFGKRRKRRAAVATSINEIAWIWNLAVARNLAPSDAWLKWYRESFEAGHALSDTAREAR